MPEQSFFENEALTDAITAGLRHLGLNQTADRIEERIPTESAISLLKQIHSILEDPSFASSIIARVPGQSPPSAPPGSLSSRLWIQYGEDKPEKMVFYRVKDSWQTTCLSLVGLTFALFAGSATAVIVPASGLLLNTWRNIVALRRPEDSLLLDAYESLLRAQASLLDESSGKRAPDVTDIHAAARQGSTLQSIEDTITGLKRLRDKGLVEVCDWAANSGDYDNPQNRWRPRL